MECRQASIQTLKTLLIIVRDVFLVQRHQEKIPLCSRIPLLTNLLTPPQKAGENPLKCRPWSEADFFHRLRTFTPQRWFGKSLALTPPRCAAQGWVNVDMDTLVCELYVPLEVEGGLHCSIPRAWTMPLHLYSVYFWELLVEFNLHYSPYTGARRGSHTPTATSQPQTFSPPPIPLHAPGANKLARRKCRVFLSSQLNLCSLILPIG